MKSFLPHHCACLLLFPLAFMLGGCEKEPLLDCVKRTGDIQIEERQVGAFDEIELRDHVFLRIVPDSVNRVRVRAGEHLIGKVRTSVTDGKLRISNENTCNWTRSYKKKIRVIAHTKDLDHLIHRGSADITTKGTLRGKEFLYDQYRGNGSVHLRLDLDRVRLKLHTGVGDLTCTGNARKTIIFNGATSHMDCEGLNAKEVFVDHRSQGNVSVRAAKKLTAIIRDKGNILSHGDPEKVHEFDNGEGDLIRKEE